LLPPRQKRVDAHLPESCFHTSLLLKDVHPTTSNILVDRSTLPGYIFIDRPTLLFDDRRIAQATRCKALL